MFDYLMDYAVTFDNSYGTDNVGRIQTLLSQIATLQSDNPVVTDGSDNIKRTKIDGELEIEYRDQAQGSAIAQQQINSKKTQILNLLDPYRQLGKYANYHSSRVMR